MQNSHLRYNSQNTAVNGGGNGVLPNSLKPPTKPRQAPLLIPTGHVVIRILCHVSRVGGLIGKSGSIIRQLQQETTAKIRVEDLPESAGSNPDPHRVILVAGSISINKKISLHNNKKNDDNNGTIDVSAAQEAAIRVFERVIEVAAETDGVTALVAVEGLVSCRLLMDRGQVGSVIGKGGKMIEMLKRNTLCKIKVLNKEKLPACAFPNDVMVELEGDIIAVKKAIIAVARCLQDCLSIRMNGGRPFQPNQHEPFLDQPMNNGSLAQPMQTTIKNDWVGPTTEPRTTSHQEVIFNLLCPNDKVGSIIGKGGSIIKALKNETGANIIIGPNVPNCNERLITISSTEDLESRYSMAQGAVMSVFNRFAASGTENEVDSCCARLVVQGNYVGCLLGKGGAIISEMRKVTGTALRVLNGDQIPPCVTGIVEIFQITGAFQNVQNALFSVTSKLREHLLPFKTGNGGNSNIPYNGVANYVDQQSALVKKVDRLKLGQTKNGSKSWTPQSNHRNNLLVKGGGVEIGSGSRSAIVKNTTVEIVVPDNVINSVYGENGTNLSRLRQISGAKVTVNEPEGGSTDTIVIISGSPDQTQAAQSLLQAFILQDQHLEE